MICHSKSRRRELVRGAGWVSLFASLTFVLMAASSPQCARTGDIPLSPATSLSSSADTGECLQACVDAADADRSEERARFRAAMEACQTSDCYQEEAAFHAGIMQEIASEQRRCMSVCHNQGSGSGGN